MGRLSHSAADRAFDDDIDKRPFIFHCFGEVRHSRLLFGETCLNLVAAGAAKQAGLFIGPRPDAWPLAEARRGGFNRSDADRRSFSGEPCLTSLSHPPPPLMNVQQVQAFLDREFPQLLHDGRAFTLELVGPLAARMRMAYHEKHLRPGGTISGPAMFGLADVTLYVANSGHCRAGGLAVTTNLNINFLRKPEPADLIGDAR